MYIIQIRIKPTSAYYFA